MEFFRAAKNFHFGSQRKLKDNDFFSDRLSHRHTTKILVVFVLLATFKRFFTSPINCWVPAELKRYEKYINKFCWIKGTYYVNQHYDLNTLSVEARQETLLHYYQWVYFFLLVQTFFFYFPRVLWCFLSHKILDYDLFNMVEAAMKHDYAAYDQHNIIRYLSANLTSEHNWLPAEKYELSNYVKKLIRGKGEGSKKYNVDFPSTQMFLKRLVNSSLTIAYVSVKLMYLANALIQLYLMNELLTDNTSNYYGTQILNTFIRGEADLANATDSRVFPRITICDVHTKELGTDHTYTVQCVLSFNLFNERIYSFLWFWIACVVVPFTVIDLLAWLNRFVLFGSYFRFKYVLNHLRVFNAQLQDKDKFLVQLFSEYYMGNNGVFILRLIEHNSNSIVVAELLNNMWQKFKIEQE